MPKSGGQGQGGAGREPGGISGMLGVSNEDNMESSLWRETLSRTLTSHDAVKSIRGTCHNNGCRMETASLHAIPCIKTGSSSLDHTIVNSCISRNLGSVTRQTGNYLTDALERKKNKFRGSFHVIYSLFHLAMSTCGKRALEAHALIENIAHRRVYYRSELLSGVSRGLAEGEKVER